MNYRETERINNKKKYKNASFDDTYSTKLGQEYVKEFNDVWRREYTTALQNRFGPYLGQEYIDNAPFMNMYEQYIKK